MLNYSYEDINLITGVSKWSLKENFSKYNTNELKAILKKEQPLKALKLRMSQKDEIKEILSNLNNTPSKFGYKDIKTGTDKFWTVDTLKKLIKDKYNVVLNLKLLTEIYLNT